MAASKSDIREWFKQGVKDKATHMIIVCDSFDWDDYPVYITSTAKVAKEYCDSMTTNNNMQQVMEVYNLSMDMDSQLAEHRANNF